MRSGGNPIERNTQRGPPRKDQGAARPAKQAQAAGVAIAGASAGALTSTRFAMAILTGLDVISGCPSAQASAQAGR